LLQRFLELGQRSSLFAVRTELLALLDQFRHIWRCGERLDSEQ